MYKFRFSQVSGRISSRIPNPANPEGLDIRIQLSGKKSQSGASLIIIVQNYLKTIRLTEDRNPLAKIFFLLEYLTRQTRMMRLKKLTFNN